LDYALRGWLQPVAGVAARPTEWLRTDPALVSLRDPLRTARRGGSGRFRLLDAGDEEQPADQGRLRTVITMVRYLVLFDTPPDPEAFDRHYREVHVPLAKSLPGLRRYSISRAPTSVRGEPYYLVAALDWDDMTALQEAFRSPAGQATGRDVANLASADRVRSMSFELEDV